VRLKRIPEDFQVEELTDLSSLAPSGRYRVYRLTKRWIGTLEAIDVILRRWRLPRHRVSFAGLKDFHGVTQQYLTIDRGPPRDLHDERIDLTYLGRSASPFRSQDVTGNRFRIVLREMSEPEVERVGQALDQVSHGGVPNYFDDQRFGSVGESGEFIAQAWCRGDYERTLWLALADPNEHDTPREREQKRWLREHWGDWEQCKPVLTGSPRYRIVSYLVDRPGDYRRAITLLDVDLRSLYVAAFQSSLWNRLLDAYLRAVCRPEQLGELALRLGTLVFHHGLQPDQFAAVSSARLPLPSARLKPAPGLVQELLDGVLRDIGLELRQIRIKYPRDTFFSKGDRAAVFFPRSLDWSAEPDDLNPGRSKVALAFELPRGCYATLLIQRVAAHSQR
jgi:tRNA pseudouridine13 synthase